MLDSSSLPYIGRFAPTPSGPLHMGSLVAALASFLDARLAGGIWLVRIENVDIRRVVKGAETSILTTLDRYGLHWDGHVLRQSERTALYEEILAELLRRGVAYHCRCSRKMIGQGLGRARDGAIIYPGNCREVNVGSVVRLRTDDPEEVVFFDSVLGTCYERVEKCVGDFVLRRGDGLMAYNFVVVVDDGKQGVNHVVRGGDLFYSTGRQVLLNHMLGFSQPQYCHVPVVRGLDGKKLSKSQGATSLSGNVVEDLWKALGFLSHCPPGTVGDYSLDTLLRWAIFNWDPLRFRDSYETGEIS